MPLPRDCSEITDPRNKQNGTHTIYPFGVQNMPAYVDCEFDANGTAWTVCLFILLLLTVWLYTLTQVFFIYFDSEISYIYVLEMLSNSISQARIRAHHLTQYVLSVWLWSFQFQHVLVS